MCIKPDRVPFVKRIPFLFLQILRAVLLFIRDWIKYEIVQRSHINRQLQHISEKFIILCHEDAIGPFVRNADLALRFCKVHQLNLTRDVVFLSSGKSVNSFFYEILERYAPVYQDYSLHRAVMARKHIDLLEKRLIYNDTFPTGVWNGKSYSSPITHDFRFSPEEERRGWKWLAESGLDIHRPIITFHNKDQVYWHKIANRPKVKDSYRDSAIPTLLDGLAGFDNGSYSFVRVGYSNPEENNGKTVGFSYISMEQFDDEQRKFLDFFLQQKCRFAVCGDSGIAHIPCFFGKPVLLHNFIPMGESPAAENSIIIPKILRWKDSGRIIPIRALFSLADLHIEYSRGRIHFHHTTADAFQSAHLYQRFNISIEDNSSEQILSGLKEIEQFAAGKLELSKSDLDLQMRFQACFPVGHPMRNTRDFLVSPHFLRQYADELLA